MPMPTQVVLSLGIVVAQAINIGTQHVYPNGWRISLALAGAPAQPSLASRWAGMGRPCIGSPGCSTC